MQLEKLFAFLKIFKTTPSCQILALNFRANFSFIYSKTPSLFKLEMPILQTTTLAETLGICCIFPAALLILRHIIFAITAPGPSLFSPALLGAFLSRFHLLARGHHTSHFSLFPTTRKNQSVRGSSRCCSSGDSRRSMA